MNTLQLTVGDSVAVFVPIFAFNNGALVNPSTSGWTVKYALRDINSSAALVYTAGVWTQDQFGVWCAGSGVLAWNTAGRFQWWVQITTPSEIKATMTGVVIVAAP